MLTPYTLNSTTILTGYELTGSSQIAYDITASTSDPKIRNGYVLTSSNDITASDLSKYLHTYKYKQTNNTVTVRNTQDFFSSYKTYYRALQIMRIMYTNNFDLTK
jgi:hypothetical protein